MILINDGYHEHLTSLKKEVQPPSTLHLITRIQPASWLGQNQSSSNTDQRTANTLAISRLSQHRVQSNIILEQEIKQDVKQQQGDSAPSLQGT